MSGWMLDTNVASHVIRGDRREIIERLVALPISDVVISSITEGELLYGLAKRGYPTALSERVREFLLRVDVLPWDHEVTKTYADLRAVCEAKGVTLSPLDMMIAAHAAATNATLVTRDKAFSRVPSPLRIEDWAEMS
ncbi:type II toxin-antitoxin system VapC family toxin [Rhodopseudomonas palustris]|uniref:Ribonuclease VapC n=1 Tax=Rhodopseudomonas palustris (strain ATCC BAA-98 / CGA009) TaxID=258594 RepID=Q6N8B2_RHOPA|nr:type II toxin-antitoxin system VapC family toxin [Rhodopseudomonas palustris]ACF00725.1 PilT protein domain protein [Rhodopseudomonas palustris TIE-1]OPF90712.1 VapC toxin family PIN domain ribonuclease [Rhodopseudomonas palustris]PPQ41075.1 PIN domain-containing protein [Rhodopseudomonas palustris]QLH71077.1 type II toxin-antitoxin system VapC family toxin [Rhodopseudomonas palustris]QQM03501.1 Ribonuclease VapC2 [Rhodopseudomonas palustris]